jgi:hypothetical protein
MNQPKAPLQPIFPHRETILHHWAKMAKVHGPTTYALEASANFLTAVRHTIMAGREVMPRLDPKHPESLFKVNIREAEVSPKSQIPHHVMERLTRTADQIDAAGAFQWVVVERSHAADLRAICAYAESLEADLARGVREVLREEPVFTSQDMDKFKAELERCVEHGTDMRIFGVPFGPREGVSYGQIVTKSGFILEQEYYEPTSKPDYSFIIPSLDIGLDAKAQDPGFREVRGTPDSSDILEWLACLRRDEARLGHTPEARGLGVAEEVIRHLTAELQRRVDEAQTRPDVPLAKALEEIADNHAVLEVHKSTLRRASSVVRTAVSQARDYVAAALPPLEPKPADLSLTIQASTEALRAAVDKARADLLRIKVEMAQTDLAPTFADGVEAAAKAIEAGDIIVAVDDFQLRDLVRSIRDVVKPAEESPGPCVGDNPGTQAGAGFYPEGSEPCVAVEDPSRPGFGFLMDAVMARRMRGAVIILDEGADVSRETVTMALRRTREGRPIPQGDGSE